MNPGPPLYRNSAAKPEVKDMHKRCQTKKPIPQQQKLTGRSSSVILAFKSFAVSQSSRSLHTNLEHFNTVWPAMRRPDQQNGPVVPGSAALPTTPASILGQVQAPGSSSRHSGRTAKNGQSRAAVSRRKARSLRRSQPARSKQLQIEKVFLQKRNTTGAYSLRSRIVPAYKNPIGATLQ